MNHLTGPGFQGGTPARANLTGLLITQDFQGLRVLPKEWVASIRQEEVPDRWRVVDKDGGVSYLPSAPPDGPWVPLGDALVAFEHLSRCPQGWMDPAGFVYPDGPPVGLAKVRAFEPAGLPCAAAAVISLIGHGRTCHWHTDEGEIHWDIPAVQVASLHPDLFKLRGGVFLNFRRLRRILKSNPRTVSPYVFVMDSGDAYKLNGAMEKLVAERLGLQELDKIQPYHAGYWRRRLRDYPYEIGRAGSERLRADFASPDVLLANLAYQAFLWGRRGWPITFGTSYRDTYYEPNRIALYHAGFLDSGQGVPREKALPEEVLFELWQRILLEMIQDGLFCYSDLGFVDEYEDERGIGCKHPEILLVAEKASQGRLVRQLAEELGLSWTVTQGVSTMVGDEFLALALMRAGASRVRCIFVVDWDEGGASLGKSMVRHLIWWGLPADPPEFLCRPELFSAEELAWAATPRSVRNPATARRVAMWVEEFGGIDGLAMGIAVNSLKPYERMKAALLAIL